MLVIYESGSLITVLKDYYLAIQELNDTFKAKIEILFVIFYNS